MMHMFRKPMVHANMKALWLLSAFALSLTPLRARPHHAPAVQAPTAVAFVKQLYDEYAWETHASTPPGRAPLFAASDSVLGKYFAPPLVAAILADRACQARVQGECNLDFDPMWNSQDPGGATVQVSSTGTPTTVEARIHYRYDNMTVVVRYQLRQTPAGWRVADMGASEWPSLMKLLQRKVP